MGGSFNTVNKISEFNELFASGAGAKEHAKSL
jgi:hypothetical protein